MEKTTEVLEQVNDIFKDVLDNDQIIVKSETTADDIEEWDSLTHIVLVVSIEKYFKIRFTLPSCKKLKLNSVQLTDS